MSYIFASVYINLYKGIRYHIGLPNSNFLKKLMQLEKGFVVVVVVAYTARKRDKILRFMGEQNTIREPEDEFGLLM